MARVMRFDYNNDKAYFYGGDGTTKIIEDLDVYAQGSPTIVSQSSNPFHTSFPNQWGIFFYQYLC